MEFAKNLKLLRKNNKLSQKELAKILECSQSVLCDYENSKSEPSIYMLYKIAKYFGVSADYLLGLENEDYTKNYEIENCLSSEQCNLLKNFNKLDERKKIMVQSYVEAMVSITQSKTI